MKMAPEIAFWGSFCKLSGDATPKDENKAGFYEYLMKAG
jgi:hypothetical protein